MIILVVNCGSSSLKYQLLDMKNDEVYDLLAKGLVERIGMEVGCLKHQATGKEKLVKEMPIADHTVGIQAVIDALLDIFGEAIFYVNYDSQKSNQRSLMSIGSSSMFINVYDG